MFAGAETLTVYVVDDEPSIADLMSRILGEAGFQVTTFYSGSEVLQLSHPLPDVLVTDFAMPGVDGASLAMWLQHHHPKCRVIMVSGNPANVPRYLWQQVPSLTLLQKPIDSASLIAAVRGETDKKARTA